MKVLQVCDFLGVQGGAAVMRSKGVSTITSDVKIRWSCVDDPHSGDINAHFAWTSFVPGMSGFSIPTVFECSTYTDR